MKKQLIRSFKHFLRPAYYRFRHRYWEAFGRPYEMLTSKRKRIIEIGFLYGCFTIIETGSYLGDTIEVCRHHYKTILSIELSKQLYEFCRWRFRESNNVSLYFGDSSQLLPKILSLIDGRVLFWLDGHYSGGSTAMGKTLCPLISELEAIRLQGRNNHIILIDDARLFGTETGYPTMGEVNEALRSINPAYQISVSDDIINAII